MKGAAPVRKGSGRKKKGESEVTTTNGLRGWREK